MRALIAAAMVAGCWTGSPPPQTPIVEPPAPHSSAPGLRVRLERLDCPRSCPQYTIEIDARRHVATFEGVFMVPQSGAKSSRVSDTEIAQIDRAIERARFFERDERGALPAQPTCSSDGTTTTCTLSTSIAICSDSPSVIISVQRGRVSHHIEHDVCGSHDELTDLIGAIEHVAHARGWIFDE